MAHSHKDGDSHSHSPKVTQTNEHKVFISFLITFSFMLVEAIGGYISGSLALLADAGHMLTDAAALGFAYMAFRIGRRQTDLQRTFGYLRFEVIAGFINALTLFGIVGWILYEALLRFQNPQPVLAGSMFAVALLGMLVNIFVLWFLSRGDTEHVNIKGAILHVMGDLLGSIGAIIAAIVIMYTGWTLIDPILSVLVSLLVLRSAWGLFKGTLHILLEGAPSNTSTAVIENHLLKKFSDITKVHHIHVWLITSGRSLATLHIQPKSNVDIAKLVKEVEHELKCQFNIEHPTVGVDWDGSSACSLETSPQSTSPQTNEINHAH